MQSSLMTVWPDDAHRLVDAERFHARELNELVLDKRASHGRTTRAQLPTLGRRGTRATLEQPSRKSGPDHRKRHPHESGSERPQPRRYEGFLSVWSVGEPVVGKGATWTDDVGAGRTQDPRPGDDQNDSLPKVQRVNPAIHFRCHVAQNATLARSRWCRPPG